MNQDSVDGIGGAHIKPSARISIHSHCSRCSTPCHRAMGRYGVSAAQSRSGLSAPSDNQGQGQDEVDNVMSKMARPASPVPVRNNRMCRRNSYDVNNECSDDDSEEDEVLSKSSPAAFSLYSDELFASANTTYQHNELHNSRNESTTTRQQNSPDHNSMNNSTNLLNHSYSQNMRQHLNKQEESSFSQLLIQILSVLVVTCFAVYYIRYYHPGEPTKMNSVYDKISFFNDVMDLGEKYKVKDTSLLQVKTGVATIFEKQDTGSFIFAYNSESDNFDPVTFNRFVDDLAATASRYLRNESATVHHVVVEAAQLSMQSAKELMSSYEAAVAARGVLLVRDVLALPPRLAMAFHYYCDEFSPLVRRSAIFFTLNLAKCSNNSDPKSTHAYIEKCLAKKWSNVGEDRIGPLLTRVVNVVVDVTSVI